MYTKIVGVAYNNTGSNSENRQNIIADLYSKGMLNKGQKLSLLPEPQNPYDSNAIAVIGADGRQLGYLSRSIAELISAEIKRGKKFFASVECVTGGDINTLYGINIQIIAAKSDYPVIDDKTRLTDEVATEKKIEMNSLMAVLKPVEVEHEYNDDDEEIFAEKVNEEKDFNFGNENWATMVPKYSVPCSLERKLFEILRDECIKGAGMATLTFLASNACAYESETRKILSSCSWAQYQYGKYFLCKEIMDNVTRVDVTQSPIPQNGWKHPRVKIYEDDVAADMGYLGSSFNFSSNNGMNNEHITSEFDIGMCGNDDISSDDMESDFFEANSYESDDFY